LSDIALLHYKLAFDNFRLDNMLFICEQFNSNKIEKNLYSCIEFVKERHLIYEIEVNSCCSIVDKAYLLCCTMFHAVRMDWYWY